MARVIVEFAYDEPFTDERYAASAERLDPCLDVHRGAWRRSSLSADRLRMICEFEAPDAEAVRAALRASDTPYERVWPADVYAVESYPEMMKKLAKALGRPAAELAASASAGQATASETNDEATAAWNGVLFDKFVRFRDVLTRGFAHHSDAAIARHPPLKGGRILDVGCGFGDVTTELAIAVAPGTATGVDVAERFVAEAQRTASAVSNASFFRADAQTDDLRGPYDAVYARFGTMFFASPVAAMRNVKRALTPRGVLCMVVWRRREDNPWVHVAEKVVRALVPEPDETTEPVCGPGPFSMASADVVSDVLAGAGFRDMALERHDAPACIGRTLSEAVDFALALGPAGEALRVAGDEGERRRPQVTAALADALAPYLTSDGVVMPSSAWIVTAR